MREFDPHLIASLYDSVTGESGLEAAMTALHQRMGCIASLILSYDPLAPYATILGTLVTDRVVARLGRIDIERVHLSGWYGCWALLPPLLACLIAGVR